MIGNFEQAHMFNFYFSENNQENTHQKVCKMIFVNKGRVTNQFILLQKDSVLEYCTLSDSVLLI